MCPRRSGEDTVDKSNRLVWYSKARRQVVGKVTANPACAETDVDIDASYVCHLLSTQIYLGNMLTELAGVTLPGGVRIHHSDPHDVVVFQALREGPASSRCNVIQQWLQRKHRTANHNNSLIEVPRICAPFAVRVPNDCLSMVVRTSNSVYPLHTERNNCFAGLPESLESMVDLDACLHRTAPVRQVVTCNSYLIVAEILIE